MKLVICAQDIQSITFGLVTDAGEAYEAMIETQPEGYLQALDQTLKEWKIALTDLSEILVVTGPGSFTASRMSTTIGNGLAFVQGIPIRGIENVEHLPWRDLLLQVSTEQQTHVLPSYDRPPEITKEKKNMLL
ncbi:MAG TPA: hypothetical protein VJB64_02285 [Patescibacteria group bacterium]|nr:hypothetical protein [Patescibacteria group bacterium]